MDHWGYWLNEPIYTDDGVANILKRKHAISMFCRDGLLPFIESAGYKFRFSEGELFRTVLQLLYTLYKGKTVRPMVNDCQYYEDQYDHFQYNLDTDKWQAFWQTWGSFQDFMEDRYAYRLQFELPQFVWSWIHMEISPSAVQLYKELEEIEYYEEVTKGKDDPYLQETARREYQDRHWH
jgi:hypothetical protein